MSSWEPGCYTGIAALCFWDAVEKNRPIITLLNSGVLRVIDSATARLYRLSANQKFHQPWIDRLELYPWNIISIWGDDEPDECDECEMLPIPMRPPFYTLINLANSSGVLQLIGTHV